MISHINLLCVSIHKNTMYFGLKQAPGASKNKIYFPALPAYCNLDKFSIIFFCIYSFQPI